MRFILKTTFGLAVVFGSFAFAGELKAGNMEDAEKALDKLDKHYALIDKNELWDFNRPSFQGKYFDFLFMKIELMEKKLELMAKRKSQKSATQFDQLLEITVNTLDDVRHHEEVILDAVMQTSIDRLHATTAFLEDDWSKCINACHKAEAHLTKIELHLPKYPQKAELARRALFRFEKFMAEANMGKGPVKKSVNKSSK